MQRLKDKVIVIAGGAGGSGAAVSKRLAAEGAKVVIGDVNIETAEALARHITGEGGEADAVAYDGSDRDSITALVESAAVRHGRIDGLHNIAGNPSAQAHDKDLLNAEVDVWLTQFHSHFVAYAHAAKIAIPIMLKTGGGSIINTSSGSARGVDVTRLGYQVAKSSVETLTRHIARAYGKQGIRCNTLCYGTILTDNVKRYLSKEVLEASLERTWSPRLGEPEDVAGIAALLMSGESGFINGQLIDINGGALIGP